MAVGNWDLAYVRTAVTVKMAGVPSERRTSMRSPGRMLRSQKKTPDRSRSRRARR